jgi:hypothetical protein
MQINGILINLILEFELFSEFTHFLPNFFGHFLVLLFLPIVFLQYKVLDFIANNDLKVLIGQFEQNCVAKTVK